MFTLLNTIKKEKEGESQRGREREEINRFSFSGVQIPNRSTGKTLPDTGTHQAKVHRMFYWQKIMTSAKRMSLMRRRQRHTTEQAFAASGCAEIVPKPVSEESYLKFT